MLVAAILVLRAVAPKGERKVFQLLPPADFSPTIEDVRRFASALTTSGPALRRWLGIPEPVVMRLRRRPPGEIEFFVEVPARRAYAIESNCYPGVQVIEVPPDRIEPSAGKAFADELVLSRKAIHPLTQVPVRPDAKTALCRELADLRPGEEAEVSLVLWDGTGAWRRFHSHTRKKAAEGPLWKQLVEEFKADGKPRPPRPAAPSLPNKVSAGPVFRMRLFVRTSASGDGLSRARAHRLAGCFSVFAGENSLRPIGALRRAFAIGRSGRFERRLAAGTVRPRPNQFVTFSEIAGLLHPPTADCDAPAIARAGIGQAAAATLPRYDGRDSGVLPLGDARVGIEPVRVGFRARDLLGPVYICGKARSGKTWLLESIAINLAEHGAGFCFIDPHRDAVEELLEYMAGRRGPLIVDLARTDRQAGLNPLEVHEEDEVPDVVSRTVCAFQAAYGWSDRTHPRTLTLARMATQALLEANLKLPDDGKATVFQITTLLTDERFRDAVLSATSPTVERYFRHEFPHYEPAAAAPLLDKISALRADRRTKLLLGQSRSTLDIRQVLDDGECLLVSLAGLGDKSQFVGSLFVYELFRAAKTRADVPAERRRPFYLLCDGVQLYQGPTLAAACGETPKFGLKLILANQFPVRPASDRRDELTP